MVKWVLRPYVSYAPVIYTFLIYSLHFLLHHAAQIRVSPGIPKEKLNIFGRPHPSSGRRSYYWDLGWESAATDLNAAGQETKKKKKAGGNEFLTPLKDDSSHFDHRAQAKLTTGLNRVQCPQITSRNNHLCQVSTLR